MTIQAARVAVTATPTLLAAGGENGVRVSVFNPEATAAYLGGGTAVTTDTGRVFPSSAFLDWYVEQGEDLYAVVASGTASLHVLKGGVQV
jgi:hypothetical protein